MKVTHITLRLSVLPFQILSATARLLFQFVCYTLNNTGVRKILLHLFQLPFRITAITTHLVCRLLRAIVSGNIAALLYLFKVLLFARATRYVGSPVALIFAYMAMKHCLQIRDAERKRKLAVEQAKAQKQARSTRLAEEHRRRREKWQEASHKHSSDPWHRQSKPHPYDQQQQHPLSDDFNIWRTRCKALSLDQASAYALPQPPGDLAALYKKLSVMELKQERLMWHPDMWSRVPEPSKSEVNRIVTEVSQIVNAIYDEKQAREEGRS